MTFCKAICMVCGLHQEVPVHDNVSKKVLRLCIVSFKMLFIGFDTIKKENSIDSLTSL